jgi:putative Holliday junction resolvase
MPAVQRKIMRIMALDVGKRRIGIAVTDLLAITARPHSTIPRNREAPKKIASIVQEMEVGKLLVGLPVHLSGLEGEQAKDVRSFVSQLGEFVSVQIEFKDERLTTVEAEQRLSDRRGDWRKKKKKIDAVAASIMLEDYLREQ